MKIIVLMGSPNADDRTFDALKAHYRTLVRYIGFRDCGTVPGCGRGTPAMTKRSGYPREAYRPEKAYRKRAKNAFAAAFARINRAAKGLWQDAVLP